jgi:heme/copper-type cytochrome/quinol oxidase subunit 2
LPLFPDGRPPSRRWRIVAWLQVAALAGWFVSQAFAPGPLINAGYRSVDNPYGIEAAGGVLATIGSVTSLLLLAIVFASAFFVVVKFRRSRGDERRQLEWVAYAGVVVILVLVAQLDVETTLP